jgi:hypothetical protein
MFLVATHFFPLVLIIVVSLALINNFLLFPVTQHLPILEGSGIVCCISSYKSSIKRILPVALHCFQYTFSLHLEKQRIA